MSLYHRGLAASVRIGADEPQTASVSPRKKDSPAWLVIAIGLAITALIYVPPMLRLHVGKARRVMPSAKPIIQTAHKKGLESWRALV